MHGPLNVKFAVTLSIAMNMDSGLCRVLGRKAKVKLPMHTA
jgi:hypothetical protein